MKKLLVALLMLVTAFIPWCRHAARADTPLVSLVELRREAATGWREDVTSIRNETISIDTEILLPVADTFPVARCAYDPLRDDAYGKDILLREAIDPPLGTVMLAKEAVEGLIYYEQRPLLADGQAENSEITADDAFQIALQLIHQCHPDASFTNAGVLAYGRAYQTRGDLPDRYDQLISCAAEMLDETMPLDDQGLYRIWLLPELAGIPLHDANIPKSYASVQDKSNFFIAYQPYQLNGYMIDDIPLCPWAIIHSSIRGEIESGRLRDVYSVRLCYMEMFESMDQYSHWHRNHDFTRIAAPMWIVHGEIYDSAKSEPNAADAARRAWPDYMMEQRVLQESSQFILIHPQTGEVLGSEFQNGRLNPKAIVAPTYTGWDGINR